MARCVTIYALNDKENLNKAAEAFNRVKALLPAGMVMTVYGTGAKNAGEVKMPGWIFGDIAQIFEFDDGIGIDDFHRTEAYRLQKQLTEGFFSIETTTNY
jgi:hypothetical protein